MVMVGLQNGEEITDAFVLSVMTGTGTKDKRRAPLGPRLHQPATIAAGKVLSVRPPRRPIRCSALFMPIPSTWIRRCGSEPPISPVQPAQGADVCASWYDRSSQREHEGEGPHAAIDSAAGSGWKLTVIDPDSSAEANEPHVVPLHSPATLGLEDAWVCKE